MNCFQYHPHQFVLLLAILGLVAVHNPIAYAASVQDAPLASPLQLEAVPAPTLGSVSVTGRNFSPSGEVYLAFYDQWGMGLFETRWVTASAPFHGPNGSQDPANGFSPGGSIYGLFGESISFYGPNGSQEPSAGFHKVDANGVATGPLCATTPMVRAFDQDSATWSDMIEVDPGC